MEVIADVPRKYQNFVDLVLRNSDPRTQDWLLIQRSPIYVWICTLAYLAFVKWIGPRFMKNRQAFNLRRFMILYNSFLVALSAYMVVEIWYSAYLNRYHPLCQPYTIDTTPLQPNELRMAKVLWWYFFSKVIEFTDTVLMVLRKKNSQITVLHIFHHASMLNIWWFTVILIPGGQSWFASSLNSLVHVVMYTYYLLNLFPGLRKYLWWKRYLTQLQLTQFVLILAHTVYTYLSGCNFPLWSIINLAVYMLIMLGLFGNFYVKSYLSKPQNKPENAHVVNGHTHHDSNGDLNGNLKHE